MILAGDIGGTNTRLALFRVHSGRLQAMVQETFPSQQQANLESLLRHFLSVHHHHIEQACFGVAGPVRHGRCEAVNLAWVVDAQHLAREVGLDAIGLINDLEANAYGIAELAPEDFLVLNQGAADASGNAAIIAAGTGLGEAGLYWDGSAHRPFASEGGHTSFGPSDTLQVELLRYLMPQYDHTSWERLVSGPGIYNIYRFLRDTGRGEEPPWLREQVHQGDPAPAISRAALAGTSQLCEQTLDLFVTLYGAEAGNLALKLMATGGVYVGGGIAPKIIQKLKNGTFMGAFVAKGRLQSLLQDIPVRVILNEKTALLGAARYATLHAMDQQTHRGMRS
jgi:glucokinase